MSLKNRKCFRTTIRILNSSLSVPVIIAIVLILMSQSQLCAQDHIPEKLTDDQIWDIYYSFITKAKPYGIPIDKEEHKKIVNPKVISKKRVDEYMSDYILIVGSDSYLYIYIDGYSGAVRQFTNTKLNSFLPEPYSNSISKPRLSEKAVLKIGKEFLKAIANVKTEDFMPNVFYRADRWFISFRRMQDKYLYVNDCVYLTFSEKYGIDYYKNTIVSKECDTNIKIDNSKSLVLAKEYLTKACKTMDLDPLKFKPTFEFIPKKQDANLVIINPCLLYKNRQFSGHELPLQKKVTEREFTVDELRGTRLAWQFDFKAPLKLDSLISIADEKEYVSIIITIFIDAITGDMIYGQYIRSFVP